MERISSGFSCRPRSRKHRPALLAGALAFLVIMHLARAVPAATDPRILDELSLEELMEMKVATVYGATLSRQSTSEAPASVSIVTSEEIKRFGWRTLSDALRGIRSFYLTNDRVYEVLGVRGLQRPGDWNSRVLLLLDGHPTNENIYIGASFGHDGLIDMGLIDRIEIIRGPGSSLYGTNAFFGVINVITKTGSDLGGVEAQVEAGSRETFKGRVSYGRRFGNGLELLLSGTRYESAGDQRLYVPAFDTPENNNGIAEDADREGDLDLFLKLVKDGFTLEGAYTDRDKTAPSAPYLTVFNTDRTWTDDLRAFLEVRYEGKIGERADLAAKVFVDTYRFRGNYLYDYATAGEPAFLVDNRDESEGVWWGARSHVVLPVGVQTLTLGAELLRHQRQHQKNFDFEPYMLYFEDERDSVNWGLFLQDEIRFGKEVILNLGLRYDHYETFGGTVNPRAALIYHPFEPTSVKLLYGTAFRAPNNYELYFFSEAYKSNTGLDPERIATYDLVLEQDLGAAWKLSAGGFHYRIRDVINLVEDPADGFFFYDNSGKVKATGGEIEIAGRWENGWQTSASYTYQEVRDEGTGAILANSPRQIGKVRVLAPLWRQKLYLGTEVQYLSTRKTVTGGQVGEQTLVNATLSTGTALLRNLELALSAYNLLDVDYDDPTANDFESDRIAQDGLTLLAHATVRF